MVRFGERRAIALLCYINFLLYVNRGIIPGAPESFQSFISDTLGVAISQQNFYLGLLQSIYVASAALFSLLFGYLSLSHKPYQLITWGLLAWVLAAIVCGVAYYAESYYVLAIGRILSGAGEAAFQCNAMPFINRHAPKKNSTVWLGLCILSFTVGNAVGYVYGAGFAGSSLTWASAFFVEGVLMAPAILCCSFCIPQELNAVPLDGMGDLAVPIIEHTHHHDKSFIRHWLHVFTNVPFTLVALGYGAYTFTMGCFATFTPTLLIGIGFFANEDDVSIVFGAIIILAGTLGTLGGGYILDRLTSGNTVTQVRRSKLAVDSLCVCVIAAAVSAILVSTLMSYKAAFLAVFSIAFLFLAAVVPAENVAVMEMFPESRQPMAIAANTAVMFIFGDVPSPMVLGWLKDTWAPLCGTVEIDGKSQLNPECYLDRSGLHDVLLFAALWLVWGVLLWVSAKFLLRRNRNDKDIATALQSPAFST